MRAIWVTVPAEGGKVINGSLIGPTKRVRAWELDGGRVERDKSVALAYERTKEQHSRIYAALDLDVNRHLDGREQVKNIIAHWEALQDVLNDKKLQPRKNHASNKEEATGVIQEKETALAE